MRTLRIHFCDFWPGFDAKTNYFVRLLRDSYELVFDDVNPELVFCSVFGAEHYRYFCRKICFLGENLDPDLNLFDYSISFRPRSERNYRLPLYAFFNDVTKATAPRVADPHFLERRFCNFLYSNPGPRERIEFFTLLDQKRHVDSGGRIRNNMGHRIDDKMKFMRQYRFAIAFENSAAPGYITEKIFQPLLAGSIPIYWGASDVESEFNAAAFINAARYATLEELRDAVLELDSNPMQMRTMVEQPIFAQNHAPEFCRDDSVLAFLHRVVQSTETPLAHKSRLYRAPDALRNLSCAARKHLYSASLRWRQLKTFRPEKLRFRSTPYTINSDGDSTPQRSES